jgi:hypothetical protein
MGGTSDQAPPFLFLLSPFQYLKADPDGTGDVAQFATDARRPLGKDVTEAAQLTRRYILIGTNKPDKPSVDSELTRLLDAAVRGTAGPSDNGWVKAVFTNNSFIEVRRHIVVNGRYLERSRPRLETWGTVVGSLMLPLLMDKDHAVSPPELEVDRTICGNRADKDLGRPLKRLRIRFYTTEEKVLNAAQIAEGDEFNARIDLSKTLR